MADGGRHVTGAGEALLSIGLAAMQVGAHPQTLREYERQGLVTPRRTAGGTRRYGEAELRRLARIQRLTAEGLSLAGVRYVLGLEDRLQAAERRLAELEGRSHADDGRRTDVRQQSPVLTRSMSLELVHVPRPRRGPRWRNED